MSKFNIKPIESTEKQKITSNLSARILKNEIGRLEFALIVDENTTLAELEKVWNLIKFRTNQLLQVQGSDPNDYRQLSRLRLARLYLVEGFSYTEVAMDANYDTLVNLVQMVSHMNDGDIEKSTSTYTAIYQRLEGLGMKHAEIGGWIKEGYENVRQGHAPWSLQNGPVDKRRIVDLVRQLEREIKKGILVINENPRGKQVSKAPAKHFYSANKLYWETAKNLLRQLPKSGGLAKLERAHQRYIESIKG